MTPSPGSHLQRYIRERLPALVPGVFEGIKDIPYYAVDQRGEPLKEPDSCPSIDRC